MVGYPSAHTLGILGVGIMPIKNNPCLSINMGSIPLFVPKIRLENPYKCQTGKTPECAWCKRYVADEKDSGDNF